MTVTSEQVTQQLRKVDDPELHRDLVSLDMVKDIVVANAAVTVSIELTTPACPMRSRIEDDVRAAILELNGIEEVDVKFTAAVRNSPQQEARQDDLLPNVKHIIAVGAGKGGVGKSTIAVNLAVALARAGARVGLLDGDVYGPSVPTMLGLDGQMPQMADADTILPFEVCGVRAMSIGCLVKSDQALIWRGPMAHGAIQQLVVQTKWGELDYMIIDLPPGTGDVPLTVAQLLPLAGAVVVCTPQQVACNDARRAVAMFGQLEVDVLGVVENMSYFIGDDGKEYDLFGRGGVEGMAKLMQLDFLGAVPINMGLRKNCDQGNPQGNFKGDDRLAGALTALANNIAGRVSIKAMQGELS